MTDTALPRWVYLNDLAPQATIMNLDTQEIRSINSAGVKNKAPIGLRRYVLNELPGGRYEETGEVVPMTVELLPELEDNMRCPNSWNFDWPHFQIEQEGDGADNAMRAHVLAKLNGMMAIHPYKFEVVGLQRRYLMYFSDGSQESQLRFQRMIPKPDSNPFRMDGKLRKKYDFIWDSNMRDAKVPYPSDKHQQYGGLKPCLYTGPAWVVRFRLDDQDPLLERCRVYVTDEGEFICSDWCQRHDFSSYGGGINLQMGIYTFDGWATGPCVTHASNNDAFKPTSTTFERHQVRDLIKKHGHGLTAPTKFEDALAKATETVTKFAKPVVEAAPVVEPHNAGPITAAAIAEAEAFADEQLGRVVAAATLPDDVLPQSVRPSGVTADKYTYFSSFDADLGKDMALGFKLEGNVVHVVRFSAPANLPQEAYEALRATKGHDASAFSVNPTGNADYGITAKNPEFWFRASAKAYGKEALVTDGWTYRAATYYRDMLLPSLDAALSVA